MAVYGIGATYNGTEDHSQEFIDMGVACVGWPPDEAPSIHAQMAAIKKGDIIFIKSFAPTAGLHIKAVGIVTDPQLRRVPRGLGWGVEVRWRMPPDGRVDMGKIEDRAD